MDKREYKHSFHILLKIYLWLMIAFSFVVIIHNVWFGIEEGTIGMFDMICLILKVFLNLADIWAFVMILRQFKSLGVWVFLTTTFFTILLSLAFPNFISLILIGGILLKAVILLLLYLKKEGLNGYQTLGMSKIDGHFIDEWNSGEKRAL